MNVTTREGEGVAVGSTTILCGGESWEVLLEQVGRLDECVRRRDYRRVCVCVRVVTMVCCRRHLVSSIEL